MGDSSRIGHLWGCNPKPAELSVAARNREIAAPRSEFASFLGGFCVDS
jgi:hypothetical protein